jgi:hypothetical protein
MQDPNNPNVFRIGGTVYNITQLSSRRWLFNGVYYTSRKLAVAAAEALGQAQVAANREAFDRDTAKPEPKPERVRAGGYTDPVPPTYIGPKPEPKLVRSLPPTEGTGQPDTRSLMQQALEDLSDGDLVQLVRDRRVFAELWDSCEDQMEAYAPARISNPPPITLAQLVQLDHGDLYSAAGKGWNGEDLQQWIMENDHTDARTAVVDKTVWNLGEVKTIIRNTCENYGTADVKHAIDGLLTQGNRPDLEFAYLAVEAATRVDREYYATLFAMEVLRA